MATSILLICNDAPYGDERLYNALRLAMSLAKCDDVDLKVFLIGNAAAAAKAGQQVPRGFYNVERMLWATTYAGATVGVCGTCLDARGLAEGPFPEGVRRSSLDELTEWSIEADKVIVF